ncbi:MAG: DUF5519 family protein [Thermomicrobiales bacterium]
MTTRDMIAAVEREVLGWSGVSVAPGRFQSTLFTVGRREIGHIHQDGIADFPFPRLLRDDLLPAGRVVPHRVGAAGYVSFALRQEEDVAAAIALFRINYDRASAASEAA